MPYSDPDNKDYVTNMLIHLEPESVLDVGPGAGAYGHMVKHIPSVIRSDCIEIWEPYIDRFALRNIYDEVILGDAREHEDFNYDVVIFGDVLEHMTREDAVAVYEKARSQAKTVIFSIPIIHVPQGAYDGNPYEKHVEDNWRHEEILEWFPGISEFQEFRVTGVYVSHA